MAEDVMASFSVSEVQRGEGVERRRKGEVPGARVLGTVVVHVLLLAIRTADAQVWVVKSMPDWSIFTNLRVFLSTCSP
jgi:hypothetical protein